MHNNKNNEVDDSAASTMCLYIVCETIDTWLMVHYRLLYYIFKAIIVRTRILNYMFISKRFGQHRPFSILKI